MRALTPAEMYGSCKPKGEDLVMAHLGLVKRVALHLKARIPAFMELDELIQVGMIGLLEASRAFDPVKGIEFENFAHSRVRGAMLDEVRRLSFLPRSAVAFNKEHNTTVHALAAELGRTPTQAEIAEYMGKDLEEFHKERGKAKRFETYSMEVVTEEVMTIADDSSQQPEVIVEEAQFMDAVTDAIAQLPEREQLVMQLYYVEEFNLKEIGETLGVSESRVSQILSSVVKKLRGTLKVDNAAETEKVETRRRA
ncbi:MULTISPECIES: RNA polymerase sigma factor FliA [unclassified Limnohabitans]|jgi:RNA polymerase sigma factor FliA|uniref:RNA polymerase sigma factor FliA n=1 Tax=unclassified Limnohabitans TaxID=2626134 RepID=UPI000CF1FB8E|nr:MULTISPECIES: RNA polymerase sigma factor FliA [unclassified Limnohabitans]PQA84671.1 FliA/WhiG family RNA polymerase sigma factor [Limnohabitans sp. TS-CS-82]BDU54738.1 RNA polymerase sigma factor FliA [Limnohabitans sp. TEGF004]